VSTNDKGRGLLSTLGPTPLRTLTIMWFVTVLGAGLGGAIGTLLKCWWPLSNLAWVMIRGQVVGWAIGAGLGYGALVVVRTARQRSQTGTPGAPTARNRSNKLLIIPLAVAVLIVALALVQWYWYFERIDVDDIIEVLESNGFTVVAIEPAPTPAFDRSGSTVAYPGEAESLVIRNIIMVIASDDFRFLDRARWFLKSGLGQGP